MDGELELVNLARSGAAALVGLMVTDGWAQVRTRVAALFRRSGRAPEQIEADLETSRGELERAGRADGPGGTEEIGDIEAEWRVRLRRLLTSDPEAAAELRALLDEVAPEADTDSGKTVNTVSGGDFRQGNVVQGRNIDVTFTLNTGRDDAVQP